MIPQISVIIPASDATATIGAQLAALLSQRCDVRYEIVVVDNNSSDDTADLARSYSTSNTPVRVVAASERSGPAYARNVGVAESAAPWVAFCDADDVVGADWLSATARALTEHEFVSGPLELDLLNPVWLADSRGRSFSNARTTYVGLFPYASSCNIAIHRDVFERVGGFDESLRVGEDVELSFRLWREGIDLHYEQSASVHYRLRPELGALFRQSRQYGAFQPVMLERLAEMDLPVPSRLSHTRKFGWLAVNAPLLRSRAGAARWLWVAGTCVGRLVGGARIRRLYI